MSTFKTLAKQRGANTTEFIVVAIPLLLVMLGIIQIAWLLHAKNQVYFATYMAARAASQVDLSKGQSEYAAMHNAFERGMIGYYGGGETQADIDSARSAASSDLIDGVVLSSEKIDDQGIKEKYIKVKAVFGVPPEKQVPFIAIKLFETLSALGGMKDASAQQMINKGRIPIVVSVTMHMSPIAMQTPPWRQKAAQNGQ